MRNNDYAVLREPDFTLDDHTIYAIGDVHGCADELGRLLDFIRKNEHGDKPPVVFFLGDLNDRGPNTRGVFDLALETFKELPGSINHMGNHEWYMIDHINGESENEWSSEYCGGFQTLLSFAGHEDAGRIIPEKYMTLLENAPDITKVDDYVFSHTGFNPTVPLDMQNKNAVRCGGEGRYFFYTPIECTCIFAHYNTMGAPWVWENNKICIDTSCFFTGRLTAAMVNKGGPVRYFQTDPDSGSVTEAVPLHQSLPKI